MTQISRLCIAIAVITAAFLIPGIGPAVEKTQEARAQESAADKYGADTKEIAIQLPETDHFVSPGKTAVTGSKYDFREQVGRAKDFFINPKRFISTRVFFLHNLSTLKPSDVKKIIDVIANENASAIFFVAAKEQPGGDMPSDFFGAPFGLELSAAIPPMTQRIFSGGDLQDGLALAGYSAVNSVAPKAWKTIGEPDVDLFIALNEPIDGLKPVGLVIIYDLTESGSTN